MGAKTFFEVKSPASKKWEDKGCEMRITLVVVKKTGKRQVMIYSDNLDFLKYIMMRVTVASNKQLRETVY